mgnify:CR=1 FL=1
MVSRGEYRGGAVPYGYCLVETERLNRSGHRKRKLCIHEQEAEVVRMIFSKIADDNWTLYALSQFLQTYSFPAGTRRQEWRKTTLQSMLKNPIYIGCMRFNDEISPPFEHLQIVDPDVFQNAQAAIRSHISAPIKNRRYPAVSEKPPIYHDLLYCGHCGAPLVFTHAFQWRSNGEGIIRYYYRCYGKERFVQACDGASSYSATILDTKIRAYVDLIATTVLEGDTNAMISNAVETERAKLANEINMIIAKQGSLQDDIEITQKRIAESLRQYGVAATTPLELYYQDLCMKNSALNAELKELQNGRQSPERQIKEKTSELKKLKTLCSEYLAASIAGSEHMMARLICKINVFQNYRLQLEPIPIITEFIHIVDELESVPLLYGSPTMLPAVEK